MNILDLSQMEFDQLLRKVIEKVSADYNFKLHPDTPNYNQHPNDLIYSQSGNYEVNLYYKINFDRYKNLTLKILNDAEKEPSQILEESLRDAFDELQEFKTQPEKKNAQNH